MTLTTKQAALLRDVVAAIIDSGYAMHDDQIDVLAHDPRIDNTAYKSDMVTYVMDVYSVSRPDAYTMLHLARKQRRARAQAVDDKGE